MPNPVGSRERFSNMIPLSVYLYTELIAAAVLALWVVTKWPQRCILPAFFSIVLAGAWLVRVLLGAIGGGSGGTGHSVKA
jgi:hypothetical protein